MGLYGKNKTHRNNNEGFSYCKSRLSHLAGIALLQVFFQDYKK